METLKEVQEYVDKQIKALEGKKELLVSLERLYEVLSKQKDLADYTIEINPDTINNLFGYIELSKNNLIRCKIEVTKDRDVGINFPLGKTEQRWINWQNRFVATEEVLRVILESLKNE